MKQKKFSGKAQDFYYLGGLHLKNDPRVLGKGINYF